MPYFKFNKSTPSFRDERDEFVDNSRNQEIALRDAMTSGRLAAPFDFFIGGSLSMPLQFSYVNIESLRAALTWGTSGGALDQPTRIIYDHKEDQRIFTPTDTIATVDITYDADGNVATTTWS